MTAKKAYEIAVIVIIGGGIILFTAWCAYHGFNGMTTPN